MKTAVSYGDELVKLQLVKSLDQWVIVPHRVNDPKEAIAIVLIETFFEYHSNFHHSSETPSQWA